MFCFCIPPKEIAIALWKVVTNSEYRSVAHLFGVGIITVWHCKNNFCIDFKQVLLPELLLPTAETLAATVLIDLSVSQGNSLLFTLSRYEQLYMLHCHDVQSVHNTMLIMS